MRAWHALLLLPLVAVAWWLVERAAQRRDDPADVLVALRASQGPQLPASAPGGSRGEADRYDRETLYELINGAADGYLERGFEACLSAVYTFQGGSGPLEVAAEAHRFRDEAGARAQLEAERPGGAAPVASVPGAVSDGDVLLAVAGRDLLKLTALSRDAGSPAALAALASAWAGKGTT